MQYVSKYSRDKYRLGRILELHPDGCGRVRTVTVGIRDRTRGVREKPEENRSGLRKMLAPVQRLVMVLPQEEQVSPCAPEETSQEQKSEGEEVSAPEEISVGSEAQERSGDSQGLRPLGPRSYRVLRSNKKMLRPGVPRVQCPQDVPLMGDI